MASACHGETGKLVFSEMTGANPTTGLVIGFLLILPPWGSRSAPFPSIPGFRTPITVPRLPVTAFLSIAPKVAAFAILLRLFLVALATFKPAWALLIVAASILSMTYGNIVAIAQRNIKRLLAYSGIAQVGNVLIGLAAGTKMGTDSILFYLLTYLFANLGAFAVIMAISNSLGTDEIDDYRGLNRRSPFLAFAMLIFLLSLVGVRRSPASSANSISLSPRSKRPLHAYYRGLRQYRRLDVLLLDRGQKMYINEPLDSSPIKTTGPLRAVIYVGLAGTLVIGIYPQPFLDWAVSATLMFPNLLGPAASLSPPTPPSGLRAPLRSPPPVSIKSLLLSRPSATIQADVHGLHSLASRTTRLCPSAHLGFHDEHERTRSSTDARCQHQSRASEGRTSPVPLSFVGSLIQRSRRAPSNSAFWQALGWCLWGSSSFPSFPIAT